MSGWDGEKRRYYAVSGWVGRREGYMLCLAGREEKKRLHAVSVWDWLKRRLYAVSARG